MKVKRKIISVLLSLLIFTQIFSTCKLNILATSGVNTFSTQTIDGYNCYVYSNPSALPNSFSVYWVYGGKVCTAPASKWLIAALNKKLGTTFTDNWFTDFNTYFMTQIMSVSSLAGDFFTGGATRVSNGSSVIGVAFNDLSGLTLENDIPSNATITTPSNCINVTYNILNNYLEDNPETPDWIQFQVYSKTEAIRLLDSSKPYYQQQYNILNNSSNNTIFRFTHGYQIGSSGDYGFLTTNGSNGAYSYFVVDLTGYSLYLENTTFETLCNNFSLTKKNNTITKTEIESAGFSTFSAYYFNLSDPSNNSVTVTINNIANNSSTTNTSSGVTFWRNKDGYSKCELPVNDDGYFTLYKNGNIVNQIYTNTYSQNFYTSTTYKNYDNSSNNSFNMSYQNVNNSQQTNQNIYNETKTTTNNNTTNNNYQIDQSVNDNSTTTIINNYYGDSGPTPDPDDDDSIWKALLAAIAEFFKKIGELLATILTGIVTLFTDILGAITQITTGFTAITDFLGSVFSWLPTEIIAILTLGLSLGVFICLIKLFK